jgi:hypothetical protein
MIFVRFVIAALIMIGPVSATGLFDFARNPEKVFGFLKKSKAPEKLERVRFQETPSSGTKTVQISTSIDHAEAQKLEQCQSIVLEYNKKTKRKEITNAPEAGKYTPYGGCESPFDQFQPDIDAPASPEIQDDFGDDVDEDETTMDQASLDYSDDEASTDFSVESLPPPIPPEGVKRVKVFFIRHGESTWNEVTDPDITTKVLLEGRKGKVRKYRYLTDAHLSKDGIEESLEANHKIEHGCDDDGIVSPQSFKRWEALCFLSGLRGHLEKDRKALFLVSNLRRAILTALITFKHRILNVGGVDDTNEVELSDDFEPIPKMYVLSSLQETARNTDSVPLTPNGRIPWLSFSDGPQNQCPFSLSDMRGFLVPDCGNKNENVPNEDGKIDRKTRFDTFCDWVRAKLAEEPDVTDLVITGHSMWLRELFQKYRPDDPLALKLSSNREKVSNNAIIEFNYWVGDRECGIESNSAFLVSGEIKKRLSFSEMLGFSRGSSKSNSPRSSSSESPSFINFERGDGF